jgi:hypothetical protein
MTRGSSVASTGASGQGGRQGSGALASNVRFWLIVVALLALSVYLSIAMWHEVQRLFGL